MKTLIFGLGNTILSDDGVGIRIAQELRKKLNPQDFDVKEGSIAGIALLDEISDYDRIIIIDSILESGKTPEPGKLHKIKLENFSACTHLASFHNVNLATVIELGKRMGYKIPEKIDIYAVEIEDNKTFSEELTPKVKEKLQNIVEEILKNITPVVC